MKTRLDGAAVLASCLLFFSGCHHHPANATADDSTAAVAPMATRAYPVALPVEAPLSQPPSQPLPPVENPGAGAATAASVDSNSGASPAADSTAPLAPQPGGVTARAPGSDIAMASPSAALESTSASDAAPPAAPNTSAPPAPESGASPVEDVVVLHTDLGAITIALDPGAAPETCANFQKLVASQFYDQTAFHRVIPNFIIQVGDPNTKGGDRSTYGDGGPGYTLKPEIKLRHDRGAVAMARLPDSINPGRESNGSQFYICVAPCPTLDGEYTVFGHVISGMDVVDKISELPHDAKYDPDTRVAITANLEPRTQALSNDSPGHP